MVRLLSLIFVLASIPAQADCFVKTLDLDTVDGEKAVVTPEMIAAFNAKGYRVDSSTEVVDSNTFQNHDQTDGYSISFTRLQGQNLIQVELGHKHNLIEKAYIFYMIKRDDWQARPLQGVSVSGPGFPDGGFFKSKHLFFPKGAEGINRWGMRNLPRCPTE